MMMMKRGRQFFLTLFVCASLCGGGVVAQTQRGAARPAAAQSGARAIENVTAPQGWQRYEIHYPRGLALRVVLPAQPEVSSDKIPMGTLPPATQYLFTSSDDQGVYVAGYLEGLPAALTADPGVRASFFKGLWEGMAEGMSEELKKKGLAFAVKAQSQREVKVGAHSAQVQDFMVGTWAGSARAVLAGGHAYMLLHISFGQQVSDHGTSFLGSFDLRPKR